MPAHLASTYHHQKNSFTARVGLVLCKLADDSKPDLLRISAASGSSRKVSRAEDEPIALNVARESARGRYSTSPRQADAHRQLWLLTQPPRTRVPRDYSKRIHLGRQGVPGKPQTQDAMGQAGRATELWRFHVSTVRGRE